MEIKLVKYTLEFIDLSRKWLLDEEVQKLTNTPTFNREEQLIWFEGLKEKTNYLIWGIEITGTKIGACGLKNISETDCEYWGYIGEKEYWKKGLGTQVLKMLENKAIELGLKSIWLKVLLMNQAAIALYLKNGYEVETTDSVLQLMRKKI